METQERIKTNDRRVYSREYAEKLWRSLEKYRAKLKGINLDQLVNQDRYR